MLSMGEFSLRICSKTVLKVVLKTQNITLTIQPMQNRSIDIDFNLTDLCKYQPVKKEKRDQSPTIEENKHTKLAIKFYSR